MAASNQPADQHTNEQKSKETRYQPTPGNPAHAVKASGPKGDNPATASPGPAEVQSNTPEKALGHINPSSPEDTNATPNTTGEK